MSDQRYSTASNSLRLRSSSRLARLLRAVGVLGIAGLSQVGLGQTFSFTGTLLSSDNTAPPVPPLITVDVPGLGLIDFFAWKRVDNGAGQVTAQAGWASLAGVPAGDLTFDFGDLELLNLAFGAGTSTESYGEVDGSPRFFNLYNQGVKIASGGDFSLEIVTDTNPVSPDYTFATGTGWVTLAPEGGHPFVGELAALQGGSSVLEMHITSFVSPVVIWNDRNVNNSALYQIAGDGGAAVVPEPGTYGMAGAMALLGFAWWSRRSRVG